MPAAIAHVNPSDSQSSASTAPTALPSSESSAIELVDVAQRLGHRWALRRVTLRLRSGETAAVTGANGSGKTTLLRVIATTLTPTRGTGRVFGHDLVTDADAVRRTTGMLGHANGLYDDLTGVENLHFALTMSGEEGTPQAVAAALAAVGAGAFGHERVRRLSSGMRRRIALARLMLRRPRLLLLDEPYNTFDAEGVAVVDRLIRDTTRAGGAAIVVTHDLERMTGVTVDRVFRLSAGRVESDA